MHFIKAFLVASTILILYKLIKWCKEKYDNRLPKNKTPTKNKTAKDVDQVFHDFVGNGHVVSEIKRIIKYKQKHGQLVLPPVGLFGQRSTGKTEIANRVASCLGQDVYSYQQLKSLEFDAPCIVFVDECHKLTKREQDNLLTALEQNKQLEIDKTHIDTSNITFIFATTDPGKMTAPFLSRLISFTLTPYSLEQVVQILDSKRRAEKNKDCLSIPHEALYDIAKAGRLIPRKAISTMHRIGMAINLGSVQPTKSNIQNDIYYTFGINEDGLNHLDMQYLKFLSTQRVVGSNTLMKYLSINRDNLENYIEPFLVQKGLVNITTKGRELTNDGKSYIQNKCQAAHVGVNHG